MFDRASGAPFPPVLYQACEAKPATEVEEVPALPKNALFASHLFRSHFCQGQAKLSEGHKPTALCGTDAGGLHREAQSIKSTGEPTVRAAARPSTDILSYQKRFGLHGSLMFT